MTNLRQLKQLLNCDYLKDDWNLSYGITKSRNDSLTKQKEPGKSNNEPGKSNNDSLFNSHSATALTLFLLGNIDGWKQIGTLKTLPRDNNSDWNKTFFDNIRGPYQKDNYDTPPSRDALWAHNKEWKEKIFVCKADDLQKSILLFEFEILNTAFHPKDSSSISKQDEPFKELSFVNLGSEWSKFDAVLIVPGEELFVFFEAKLLYDIKLSTKNYPINQIMRNLESAFLLTNHQDSLYKDWKFKYVLICPRKKSQGKHYNAVFDSPVKYISSYKDFIEKEYKSSIINKGCYREYFESFARQIPDCIYKIYWDELGDVLTDQDKNFFRHYLNCLKEEDRENIKDRFKLAEIKGSQYGP